VSLTVFAGVHYFIHRLILYAQPTTDFQLRLPNCFKNTGLHFEYFTEHVNNTGRDY